MAQREVLAMRIQEAFYKDNTIPPERVEAVKAVHPLADVVPRYTEWQGAPVLGQQCVETRCVPNWARISCAISDTSIRLATQAGVTLLAGTTLTAQLPFRALGLRL